jgi:hypothetical protein
MHGALAISKKKLLFYSQHLNQPLRFMRKIVSILLVVVMSATAGFAAMSLAPAPLVKASSIRIPIGSTGKFINLQDLATIKTADFESLSGRKMSWLRRMEFKLAQKKIRRSINADGTVNDKKLATMAGGYYDDDNSFHIGGFALGFFLGLIGVIIAYIINDDNHHRRVKWAWFGFGMFVAVLLIVAALAARTTVQ